MTQHGSHTDGGTRTAEGLEPRGEAGTQSDPILEEHVEKALDRAADPTARYHLRAALQRFEFD